MSDIQMTFMRYEMKYLLDETTYRRLRDRLGDRLVVDQYGKTTICNIYYDTQDYRLIRASLEKPVYKEKLRLRSYGTPGEHQTAFLELKKKYKGVVYKRREMMVLAEAMQYLNQRQRPGFDSQILREIDWFMQYYETIHPAMYISYERVAMYGAEDASVRVTFDSNILWREDELELMRGSYGHSLLKPGQRLMEIKIAGAMPLWLGAILDECKIYPVSFSKYGRAYQEARHMGVETQEGSEEPQEKIENIHQRQNKIIVNAGGIYCA